MTLSFPVLPGVTPLPRIPLRVCTRMLTAVGLIVEKKKKTTTKKVKSVNRR